MEKEEEIIRAAKSPVSAKALNYKRVVDTRGSELGVSHKIVADAETGMLIELVVKPKAKHDTSEFKKEGDHIFIPFDAVKGIKDVILVDSEKIRKGYAEKIGQPSLNVDDERKREEVEQTLTKIRKRSPGAIKEEINE
ncbi:MAG: PRC-barrel domain-containing protein [archaeon]|nr:PRC-barrel domain-containing protein [archaeon]